MTDISQVEHQLQEAAVAVDAAGTLIGQGQIIDLIGLERHVDQICTDIARLSPAICAGLKPALIMLIDGLNGLTRKLSDQHQTWRISCKGCRRIEKPAALTGQIPPNPGDHEMSDEDGPTATAKSELAGIG